MVQHWEYNWLKVESQVESTLRIKLTQLWELNWLKYSPVTHFARSYYNSASDSTFKVKTNFSSASDNILGQILVPPATQLLGLKWLNYFSRCTKQKIESFWHKKLGQILVPPVTQVLASKWPIFSLGALSEKIESLWPKKLGWILIPPVTQLFLSQMTEFFLSVHWEKYMYIYWVILT